MWLLVACWLASALVFSTFFMKTMIPLRLVAIASNVAFMSYALLGLKYGVFGRLYPILVLHSCMLPLNLVRLRQLRTLVGAVAASSEGDALQALVPWMKTELHSPGEVLFRRGDDADKLYVLQQGQIAFAESGKQLRAGAVFGEVGLFAPEGTRSMTAVCQGHCRVLTITKAKTLELYHQNPQLGMLLIRLVAGYAVDNVVPTPTSPSGDSSPFGGYLDRLEPEGRVVPRFKSGDGGSNPTRPPERDQVAEDSLAGELRAGAGSDDRDLSDRLCPQLDGVRRPLDVRQPVVAAEDQRLDPRRDLAPPARL